VGDAVTDTDNDNAEIGLYISGVNQVITAPNSSVDYGTYLATTAGGSFSKLANSEDNTAPQPMITGDGATTLYIATENNGSGDAEPARDYEVTFDDVGDATHDTSGSVGTTVNETESGNGGGNAAYSERTATTLDNIKFSLFVNVTVSETAITDIDIEFDVYMDLDMSSDPLLGSSNTQYVYVESVAKDSGTERDSEETLYDSDTKNTGQTFVFTKNQEWNTISHSLSFSSSDIDTVFVWIGAHERLGTLSTTTNDIDSTSFFKIDNVKIWIGGKPASTPVDPLLYKVTTYTATDSWSDVTPATDYIPQLPYGLAVDIADSANIELMATDDSTPKYFDSTNTAGAWADNGASDYRAVKRLGDAIIYGGTDALDLSVDNGATVSDKTGNLAIVWGTIGTIKQVLVLV
jgi:hypothetical protein